MKEKRSFQDPNRLEKLVMEKLDGFIWNSLRKDPEIKDRRITEWGTKTLLGFARCVIRIVDEAKTEGDS